MSEPTPAVLPDARALIDRLTHNIETQRVLVEQTAPASVEREAARLAYAVMRDARAMLLATSPASDAPASGADKFIQAARDAAASFIPTYAGWGGQTFAEKVRLGKRDDHELVKAFLAAILLGYQYEPDDAVVDLPLEESDLTWGLLRQIAAAAPKVASDTGAGLRCPACQGAGWVEHTGSIMPGIGIPCDEFDAAALATDATNGATGGGEGAFFDAVKRYSHPAGTEVVVRIHEAGWDVYDPITCPPSSFATTPGGDLLEQAARKALALVSYITGLPEELRWTPEFTRWVSEQADRIAAIRALSARNQTDDGGEK